ncbi:MGC154811 protein [Paramicrosporidium saccamoebae]|uniref:peptidyl-tRNA hydrolase n=1 Tax=Paramicrosporidium saccamoebae TaxID=1246581 RepID=A0A2H9TPW7_9FUNG|nr:MGC154811 protein [Paramicrosporidium saccamoebae]
MTKLVQYVILNNAVMTGTSGWFQIGKFLGWGTGEIATQACHACVAAISTFAHLPDTQKYISPECIQSMTKTTSDAEFRTTLDTLNKAGIEHYCWTEQPENTMTCIALRPYEKSTVSRYLRQLNLQR